MNYLPSLSGGSEQEPFPIAQKGNKPGMLNQWLILNPGYT